MRFTTHHPIGVANSKKHNGLLQKKSRQTHEPQAFTGDGFAMEWLKSGYSSNDGPGRVEVVATRTLVRVRDSKRVPGPQLAASEDAWKAFIEHSALR